MESHYVRLDVQARRWIALAKKRAGSKRAVQNAITSLLDARDRLRWHLNSKRMSALGQVKPPQGETLRLIERMQGALRTLRFVTAK